MPEKGVLCLNEREVGFEERKLKKIECRQDPDMFGVPRLHILTVDATQTAPGTFITHPFCCANTIDQPTVSLHVSSPADPEFIALPRLAPPKQGAEYTCAACERSYSQEDFVGQVTHSSVYSPAAGTSTNELVNTLHIEGHISAKARGEELLLGIINPTTGRNFLIRVYFALEGHCFWMPTAWYHNIVSRTPVKRDDRSFAFPIPDEYIDGPLGDRIISIQAAFIRPKFTLVFCDHTVMMQLHVMQIRTSPQGNMTPGSPIWNVVWNAKHGPVYHQEPEATLAALARWRDDTRKHKSTTTIFAAIKTAQSAFNGSGPQEATDILLAALTHPQMPAFEVCNDNATWARLLEAVKIHDQSRVNLALPGSPLPYVSSSAPFHMRTNAHGRYLTHVSTYRRREVTFNAEMLERAHDLGLFIPNTVIQPKGRAVVPAGVIPAAPTFKTLANFRVDRAQASAQAPNYMIKVPLGSETVTLYSPFTAKAGEHWASGCRELVVSDVREEVGTTTLGLYSFRVFVDCVYSLKTVAASGGLPSGPRKVTTVDGGSRKRPTRAAIEKAGNSKKRKVSAEESEPSQPPRAVALIPTHARHPHHPPGPERGPESASAPRSELAFTPCQPLVIPAAQRGVESGQSTRPQVNGPMEVRGDARVKRELKAEEEEGVPQKVMVTEAAWKRQAEQVGQRVECEDGARTKVESGNPPLVLAEDVKRSRRPRVKAEPDEPVVRMQMEVVDARVKRELEAEEEQGRLPKAAEDVVQFPATKAERVGACVKAEPTVAKTEEAATNFNMQRVSMDPQVKQERKAGHRRSLYTEQASPSSLLPLNSLLRKMSHPITHGMPHSAAASSVPISRTESTMSLLATVHISSPAARAHHNHRGSHSGIIDNAPKTIIAGFNIDTIPEPVARAPLWGSPSWVQGRCRCRNTR
ncbi:hypothetical protein C8R46DRAFT_1325842 [Mycena filopes]|nr:hypothetical protein C8R46DRAFT_1325842 [Mycena filopes]